MKNKKIDFYFDFLSPYSYLAWTWVRKAPYEFNYVPVSIPSIVAHYKTLGPAQIEPKRNYLFKDLLRFTKLNAIPFVLPKELPFNALYALRLALKNTADENQKIIIDTIFRAGWEHGLDIGKDDELKKILLLKNLPVEELFFRMEEKRSRMELKSNIEEAIQKGVFGVPTFVVDNELFWGNDSIIYLEKFLNDQDPLDLDRYNNFLEHFKARD